MGSLQIVYTFCNIRGTHFLFFLLRYKMSAVQNPEN